MNASPFSPMSAAELLAGATPARADVLTPLIGAKGSVLVYGAPGVGKTFFALGVAWAAAAGGSFLGWHAARQNRVVYVDGDHGAEAMRARLPLFGALPPLLQFILPGLRQGALLDLTRIEAQHDLMESWGDPHLAVLDSPATLATLPGGNSRRWERLDHFLQRQKTYGRAMVVVDGVRADGGPGIGRQRARAFDVVIGLHRPDDWRPSDRACFEITFDKVRPSAGLQALRAQLTTGPAGGAHWQWRSTACRVDRAAELLKSGSTVKTMAEILGVSLATGYRLRGAADARGLLPTPTRRRPADDQR